MMNSERATNVKSVGDNMLSQDVADYNRYPLPQPPRHDTMMIARKKAVASKQSDFSSNDRLSSRQAARPQQQPQHYQDKPLSHRDHKEWYAREMQRLRYSGSKTSTIINANVGFSSPLPLHSNAVSSNESNKSMNRTELGITGGRNESHTAAVAAVADEDLLGGRSNYSNFVAATEMAVSDNSPSCRNTPSSQKIFERLNIIGNRLQTRQDVQSQKVQTIPRYRSISNHFDYAENEIDGIRQGDQKPKKAPSSKNESVNIPTQVNVKTLHKTNSALQDNDITGNTDFDDEINKMRTKAEHEKKMLAANRRFDIALSNLPNGDALDQAKRSCTLNCQSQGIRTCVGHEASSSCTSQVKSKIMTGQHHQQMHYFCRHCHRMPIASAADMINDSHNIECSLSHTGKKLTMLQQYQQQHQRRNALHSHNKINLYRNYFKNNVRHRIGDLHRRECTEEVDSNSKGNISSREETAAVTSTVSSLQAFFPSLKRTDGSLQVIVSCRLCNAVLGFLRHTSNDADSHSKKAQMGAAEDFGSEYFDTIQTETLCVLPDALVLEDGGDTDDIRCVNAATLPPRMQKSRIRHKITELICSDDDDIYSNETVCDEPDDDGQRIADLLFSDDVVFGCSGRTQLSRKNSLSSPSTSCSPLNKTNYQNVSHLKKRKHSGSYTQHMYQAGNCSDDDHCEINSDQEEATTLLERMEKLHLKRAFGRK